MLMHMCDRAQSPNPTRCVASCTACTLQSMLVQLYSSFTTTLHYCVCCTRIAAAYRQSETVRGCHAVFPFRFALRCIEFAQSPVSLHISLQHLVSLTHTVHSPFASSQPFHLLTYYTPFSMIIPVRCFTCGKVVGNKWEQYLQLLQADYTEK